MNLQARRITIMRDEKIPKALIKLVIPSIIGMIINAIYNVIDAYFVSGLGTAQIGAVAISFPLAQIIIGIGLIFGCGAAMCISRQLGEGKNLEAGRTASTAVFGSIITGVIVLLLIMAYLDTILIMLGATPTILPYAREYTSVFMYGCILNIFFVTMTNITLSEGAAKRVMFTMLAGGVLNTILDPIFIYTLDYGVQGAAIATVISFMLTSILYLSYILSRKSSLRISPRLFSFNRSTILNILKLGIPVFIIQLLSGIAMGLTNSAASQYGDSAVAAVGIVTRIIALASYVIFGYVKGFQPIVGFNYGAGSFQRVTEAINTSLRWIIYYGICIAAIFLFLPHFIMSFFTTSDSSLLTLGISILRANSIPFILFGVVMLYSTLFLALGKASQGGLLNIARQGLFFIPIIFILPKIFGLNGIIFSQPLADILTFAVALSFALQFRKQLTAAALKRV